MSEAVGEGHGDGRGSVGRDGEEVVRSVAAAVERQAVAVTWRGNMGTVKQVVSNGVERVLVGGGPKERDGGAFDFIFAC